MQRLKEKLKDCFTNTMNGFSKTDIPGKISCSYTFSEPFHSVYGDDQKKHIEEAEKEALKFENLGIEVTPNIIHRRYRVWNIFHLPNFAFRTMRSGYYHVIDTAVRTSCHDVKYYSCCCGHATCCYCCSVPDTMRSESSSWLAKIMKSGVVFGAPAAYKILTVTAFSPQGIGAAAVVSVPMIGFYVAESASVALSNTVGKLIDYCILDKIDACCSSEQKFDYYDTINKIKLTPQEAELRLEEAKKDPQSRLGKRMIPRSHSHAEIHRKLSEPGSSVTEAPKPKHRERKFNRSQSEVTLAQMTRETEQKQSPRTAAQTELAINIPGYIPEKVKVKIERVEEESDQAAAKSRSASRSTI